MALHHPFEIHRCPVLTQAVRDTRVCPPSPMDLTSWHCHLYDSETSPYPIRFLSHLPPTPDNLLGHQGSQNLGKKVTDYKLHIGAQVWESCCLMTAAWRPAAAHDHE